MQDDTGDRALLMLSQSQWTDADPDDARSRFLQADSRENLAHGGTRNHNNCIGGPDSKFEHHPGFNSEADQRVAGKLDRLLSDIERRVEAKEELERIQDRVKMSIMEYQDPSTARAIKAGQLVQRIGPAAYHLTSEQRKQRQNIYKGLTVEHRVRLATSSFEEMHEKVGSISVRTARQTGMLGEMSAWFGQAREVGFNILHDVHHEHAQPEGPGSLPLDMPSRAVPSKSGANNRAHRSSNSREQREGRIDLSSEEGLRQHMESLDQMMASVRDAASTLQVTHETVVHSQDRKLRKQRQDLEKREANVKKSEKRRKDTDTRKLGKTRVQLRKKDGVIAGLTSALRESQLIVDKQAVKAKARNEQIDALKRHVRRLQRDVEDTKGIGKHMRIDAEVARDKLAGQLKELEKSHAVLKTELASTNKRLAAAPPRVLTPTCQVADSAEISQERVRQMRQQHQTHIDEVERNNAIAMQRLKAHMLRMEGSSQQNNEAQMKGVASIMKLQKERMLVAMDRQRKEFDAAIERAESETKNMKVEHAREIEILKNKWDKDSKEAMAVLRQQVEDAAQLHGALMWKAKREHAKEVEALEKVHEEKLRNVADGATNKLVDALQTKKDAGKEAEQFQLKMAKAEARMATQVSVCEEQRVSLANRAQTIVGLEYQISEITAALTESNANALHFRTQVETSNELLEELRKNAEASENVVLGADQDMQLSPEEAQNMITALGMRVLELEQSLSHVTRASMESDKSQRGGRHSGRDGFRQFERFSYMPTILAGIGESLEACAQLSNTLYLLREVPNWAGPIEVDGDNSINANQVRAVDSINDKTKAAPGQHSAMEGNAQEMSAMRDRASTQQRAQQNCVGTFNWEHDWEEHLLALAGRIDGMTGMFRTALTGFRAEMNQRKHYEEVMCLHFYKREQHWKALYEAMLRSGGARGAIPCVTPRSPEMLDASVYLSAGAKTLSTRKEPKQVDVQQPLLLENSAKREDGATPQRSNHVPGSERTGKAATVAPARNTEQFTMWRVQERKTSTRIQPPHHRQDPTAALAHRPCDTFSVPPSSASCTKALLPRSIGQSGTVNLKRSAAGATFYGGPVSQSTHYANMGWTPTPPPLTNISQFTRPNRSPKAKMGKLRGRLLPADVAVMPAATASVGTTSTSKVRPAAELSSVLWDKRTGTRSRSQHKKFSYGRVERGRGIFIGGMSPLSQSQVGRHRFKKMHKKEEEQEDFPVH